MRAWFVPCPSGDFRLTPDPKVGDQCLLSVVNPTALDRQRLGVFLERAREQGWVDAAAGIAAVGTTELVVRAPITLAGATLAAEVLPDRETWTAIRDRAGQVTLSDAPPDALAERLSYGLAVTGDQAALLSAEAVVTVERPGRGCPPPEAARRRASEVLTAFSTARQISTFVRKGWMLVRGGSSGKPYQIFHRDLAHRLGLGHTILDLERQVEVCAWDDELPPEEEVLSLKLGLEHREAWLTENVGGFQLPRPRRMAA